MAEGETCDMHVHTTAHGTCDTYTVHIGTDIPHLQSCVILSICATQWKLKHTGERELFTRRESRIWLCEQFNIPKHNGKSVVLKTAQMTNIQSRLAGDIS